MRRIFLGSFLMFCLSQDSLEQTDYWTHLVYFSGTPTIHIPKGISIPQHDSLSKSIMNGVISGLSNSQLSKIHPDSFKSKITALVEGNVLLPKNGYYQPTFPLFINKKRTQLQDIVHEKTIKIIPSIDSMVSALGSVLINNRKMVFHFLWSRIIDDCWWDLYNSEFHTDQGPPSIVFIIYPEHPFQCGTNFDYTSDTGQIAISWSYDIFSDVKDLPSTTAFYNLSINKTVSVHDKDFFIKHGLLYSNDVANIFTYNEQDALDSLCDILKKKYRDLVRGLYDFRELSNVFDIPADELFIVIGHETAYEIFKLLHERDGSLFFPIIKKNNPTVNFSYLVSIRRPPH